MSNSYLTTEATIVPDVPNELGFKALRISTGEEYVGDRPGTNVKTLATILHSSDWHICDAESPARQEYLDRYFDPNSPYRAILGYVGTYRPWEILTTQVAAAFIETLNRIEVGPVSKRPVDALVITGDVTDNGQLNELEWYLNLLDGHEVNPAGGRSKSDWVGSTSNADWDERYWHPDGEDSGRVDLPTGHYGYPNVPGLIAAARKPFKSSGLRHPWLSVHGNHDALLQGTVAPDAELNELATGNMRIVGLAPEQTPFDAIEAIPTVGPARYIHTKDSPRQEVVPDDSRRLASPGKFAELHLNSSSLPHGHGFTTKNASDGTAYYSYQVGEMILVALDTVNHHGGFEGSITESQLKWLESTLVKFSDRHVVIASHHPSPAIINDYQPEGTEPRVLGPEILATLMNHKNVLVWINGHEHENQIILNVGPDGRVLPEINTASIIDWPQQARILEFSVDSDSAYITSTVINHDGRVDPDLERLDLADMAGLSRILAFNDYQRRDPLTSIHRKEGSIADRNFVLRLPNLLSPVD